MCNKIAATIVVDTDLYPFYFSWKLSNTKSDITIASMGPFQKAYTHYEHTECLEEGKYIFTAYDTRQDGLTKCYDNNSCGYHLSVDGKIVLESDDVNFEMKDHTFHITLPTSKPTSSQPVKSPRQKKKSNKKKKHKAKKKKSSNKKTKQSKKAKKKKSSNKKKTKQSKKKKKSKHSKETVRRQTYFQKPRG